MKSIEGTWEEIIRYGEKLEAKRFRLTPLPEQEAASDPEPCTESVEPNWAGLKMLEEIAKIHEGKPFTSGENTQKYLREARAGGMYGYEPTSDE